MMRGVAFVRLADQATRTRSWEALKIWKSQLLQFEPIPKEKLATSGHVAQTLSVTPAMPPRNPGQFALSLLLGVH